MPENAGNPLSFWQELKRRKVIRVITVYAAAAFAILELVDIISPSLGLPDKRNKPFHLFEKDRAYPFVPAQT